jgi:hypothetical protein
MDSNLSIWASNRAMSSRKGSKRVTGGGGGGLFAGGAGGITRGADAGCGEGCCMAGVCIGT